MAGAERVPGPLNTFSITRFLKRKVRRPLRSISSCIASPFPSIIYRHQVRDRLHEDIRAYVQRARITSLWKRDRLAKLASITADQEVYQRSIEEYMLELKKLWIWDKEVREAYKRCENMLRGCASGVRRTCSGTRRVSLNACIRCDEVALSCSVLRSLLSSGAYQALLAINLNDANAFNTPEYRAKYSVILYE